MLQAAGAGVFGNGYAHAQLYDYSNDTLLIAFADNTNNSTPFAYFGTLGPGDYYVYLLADSYAYGEGVITGNSNFDASLVLTPSAAVPDGGDAAVMFLFGTALLWLFAARVRPNLSKP